MIPADSAPCSKHDVPTFFRYFKPISARMALLLACSPDLNDPHIGIYSMYIYKYIYIYIDR